MHLLPLNLASLSDITDKNSYSKFLSSSVHVAFEQDSFLAEATDGKRVVRVKGSCPDSSDYPASEQIQNAPNGQTDALVLGSSWKQAFQNAVKLTRKAKVSLNVLATKISDKLVSFSATNLVTTTFEQPSRVEGRFLNVERVIPKTGAKATFKVETELFADTLAAVAKLGVQSLFIEVHDNDILAFRGETEDGQKVDGAFVCLKPYK